MTLEEKNKYIEDYIKNMSLMVNTQYGTVLIDEEKINRALSMFKDSQSDLKKDIIPKINELVQKIINEYLEYQKKLQEIANTTINPEQLDTQLRTNKQGMYLSSLMVKALSLINSTNIEEINKWIESVPNLYMISPFEDKNYSLEQIEAIKKKLFEVFQDSLISTEAIKKINSVDREDAMRFSLHKKLSGLGLSLEEELKLGDKALSKGLPSLYEEVQKLCIQKFGIEEGTKILKKIVNYFTTDFENFNSTTYEQMEALNEEIKSRIQKCNESNGDFQFVIDSLNYSNTVNNLENGNFEYNYNSSEMGLELAKKLNSSCRLRSMINRNTADEMILKGFTKNDKEKVIQILRDSLKEMLQIFNSSINDRKNRTFELFNELVEIQKSDRIYKCVWEDKFGITLEDLIKQVVMPNIEVIKELKKKNVDFMYNETLLQESREKREKVMETMTLLQQLMPGLITVFGDQDHTFGSDYREENIEQLKETALFDKKMSEMVFGNGIKVKIECAERDIHLSQSETTELKNRGITKEDILKYKQAKFNIHGEIYKDVPFVRECEWTVIDNLSGDYYEHEMDTREDSYIGRYTKISSLGRKDNTERVNRDIFLFNNWKEEKEKIKKQKEQESFALRSQKEVEIAEQIKQKNQMIKEQKRKEKDKIKALIQDPLNNPPINGYVTVIVLSLIVSFVSGALFMVVYILLGGKF